MKILFAASECFPFIKTGGLADVVGSLPKELVREGAEVSVMLPKYTQIDEYYIVRMQHVCHFNLQFGSYSVFCGIDKLEQDGVNSRSTPATSRRASALRSSAAQCSNRSST